MQTERIQKELEKEFEIVDNGTYKVENPIYNAIYTSVPREKLLHEFPIEVKKAIKIIKLPFNMILAVGKETKKTFNEVLK